MHYTKLRFRIFCKVIYLQRNVWQYENITIDIRHFSYIGQPVYYKLKMSNVLTFTSGESYNYTKHNASYFESIFHPCLLAYLGMFLRFENSRFYNFCFVPCVLVVSKRIIICFCYVCMHVLSQHSSFPVLQTIKMTFFTTSWVAFGGGGGKRNKLVTGLLLRCVFIFYVTDSVIQTDFMAFVSQNIHLRKEALILSWVYFNVI